ncbi:hypothetical protein BIU82_06905 [Arthrobacter sp. SW1]|uniref:hypothetical protein n=1 Tax=Arthrobacter sp. SW1 TaxID=1920889 RepID=UPI000877C5B0|nr:hypothetical protein [Arthrobacter sp. SW1]OFI37607.1 hypothetical protein BIU82_06905 [Arthrobacter sp. SW1]
MPFDAATGTTIHADAPAVDTNPLADPTPRRVLPCVDAGSGWVLLFTGGNPERYRCAEADVLLQALARAVRPALWFPAERKLLLAVAARGCRSGKELPFILD